MCLAASTRKPIYRDVTELRIIDLSHTHTHTHRKYRLCQLPGLVSLFDNALITNLRFPWLFPALVTSSGASGMVPVSGVEIRKMKVSVSLSPFIDKAKSLLPITIHGLCCSVTV